MKKDSLFNLSTYKNVKNIGVRQKYYIKNKSNYVKQHKKCYNKIDFISKITSFNLTKLEFKECNVCVANKYDTCFNLTKLEFKVRRYCRYQIECKSFNLTKLEFKVENDLFINE